MINTEDKTCVVIGASHAGAQLAVSVRRGGWKGKIVVISDEPYLPYHRPPLSKDFLKCQKHMENILLSPASVYQKLAIKFMLGSRVEEIDRKNKTLQLDSGATINYDKLALTLGARVREVPIPGVDKKGVFYLRTVNDIEAIRPYVVSGKNAVIVGGGYIGLEAAAALRQLGMNVTVLEMMPRILQRVTAPEMSAFYSRVHQEEGVNIIIDTTVEMIEGGEHAESVRCSDGSAHEAHLVIIGAGILPNIELAEQAGLEVDNGIVVDEYAQTSDPDIVSAGDCTRHYNPIYDQWLRLESVQNAVDQAKVAAASICGEKKPYKQLPWFWSDQYDMKLQIAGLSQGYDDVVIRGDIEHSRQFSAFYFINEKLIAVDAVNMPAAFMIGKRLLLAGTKVDKAKVADESVDLKSLL